MACSCLGLEGAGWTGARTEKREGIGNLRQILLQVLKQTRPGARLNVHLPWDSDEETESWRDQVTSSRPSLPEYPSLLLLKDSPDTALLPGFHSCPLQAAPLAWQTA